MDERKLFNDAQVILKMYQKAGLQRTTVDYKPSITESLGRGIVTFEVQESPKVKIKEVLFEDAPSFKQRKLRKGLDHDPQIVAGMRLSAQEGEHP
jgi:outer membrane protein assembly factor BamA